MLLLIIVRDYCAGGRRIAVNERSWKIIQANIYRRGANITEIYFWRKHLSRKHFGNLFSIAARPTTTPFPSSTHTHTHTVNSFACDKLNNSIFYWVPCNANLSRGSSWTRPRHATRPTAKNCAPQKPEILDDGIRSFFDRKHAPVSAFPFSSALNHFCQSVSPRLLNIPIRVRIIRWLVLSPATDYLLVRKTSVKALVSFDQNETNETNDITRGRKKEDCSFY